MKNYKNNGFSLVELLISVTLGIMITGGVIQVLMTANSTYKDLVVQSRMQETGKIALDYITRDLRNVGFVGCDSKLVLVADAIAIASNKFFSIDGVLNGYDQGDVTAIGDYNSLLANSDLLELYLPEIDKGYQVTGHIPPTFTVNRNVTPQGEGTVWMAVDANCANVGLFVQSNPGGSATVWHSVSADNCTALLRGDFDCSSVTGSNLVYAVGTMLYPMKRVAFGIQPSNEDVNINALYGNTQWQASDGQEELLLGVNSLEILYGLDVAVGEDNAVERYVTASTIRSTAGLEFSQTIAVRVIVTVGAIDGVDFDDQSFTTTVRLRNRGV